ncbi:hypothetical protein PO461_07970 [Enterobacter asburiae]|uniref:hypothetical protein n=1 Tax=Enterobacter asburiae TaxID=61645 RepID=UPI002FF72521
MTHAIKQIVDTDGEPMMEVVVSSDCSAVDMEAIHAEALELNAEIDDGKTMDMYHKWNTAPTAQIRRDMLAVAHTEALVMNVGIELALHIITAMGGSESAGDAAGGCLYRDGFNEINYLVSVALSLYSQRETAHAEALEMNTSYT